MVELLPAALWLATLYRNTKFRKLAYIERDGKLMFKRANVERYDAKRYVREEWAVKQSKNKN